MSAQQQVYQLKHFTSSEYIRISLLSRLRFFFSLFVAIFEYYEKALEFDTIEKIQCYASTMILPSMFESIQ